MKRLGDGYYWLSGEDHTRYKTVSEAMKAVKIHAQRYKERVILYRSQQVYGVYWYDNESKQIVGVRK